MYAADQTPFWLLSRSSPLGTKETMTPDYNIDENHGFLRQARIFNKPMVYDQEYIRQRYDTYTTNELMSMLRLDLIKDHCGRPKTVFDFGYGNGAFLRQCVTDGIQGFGYDISGYPIPDGAQFTSHENLVFDVVTMFDVFEHLSEDEQRHMLGTLRCKWLVISVPWCHAMELGLEWFSQWRHRRPDEHFSAFGAASLCSLLKVYKYVPVYVGCPEDAIRKPTDHLPNILTVVFKRT